MTLMTDGSITGKTLDCHSIHELRTNQGKTNQFRSIWGGENFWLEAQDKLVEKKNECGQKELRSMKGL